MNLSDAEEENRSTNTRENEKESICDGCSKDPESCGLTEKACRDMFEDSHDEATMEALRDGYYDD